MGIKVKVEAYIQPTAIKKTLVCVSSERRKGIKDKNLHENKSPK